MTKPILYKQLNVELDKISPCEILGGELIKLTCSGIFNSNVKLGTLKIGEVERVVNLKQEDDNTLSFTAPPIEWIKNTKYLATADEQDVEVQQPEDAEHEKEQPKTEENAENVELTKDEKVDAIVKKAKIEPAEFAESMYTKY